MPYTHGPLGVFPITGFASCFVSFRLEHLPDFPLDKQQPPPCRSEVWPDQVGGPPGGCDQSVHELAERWLLRHPPQGGKEPSAGVTGRLLPVSALSAVELTGSKPGRSCCLEVTCSPHWWAVTAAFPAG